MKKKFVVSAPGRVFLIGNPLRYKDHCVASTINLRTRLEFSVGEPSKRGFIKINFSEIDLYIKIPLERVVAYFVSEYFYRTLDTKLYSKFTNGITKFVESLVGYPGTYQPDKHSHRLSLKAFFFLLIFITYTESVPLSSPFSVKVTTQLPMNEDLGASTSFTTCLAACFYKWSLLQKKSGEKFEHNLLKVLKYVHMCDSIIFKSLDKIGSSVIVYGSTQFLLREVIKEIFCYMPYIKIILVHSNVKSKKMIELKKQMEKMKQSYPFIESIFNSIDNLITPITYIFRTIEDECEDLFDDDHVLNLDDCYHLISKELCLDLSLFIKINHSLLSAIGMTHPNVDMICTIAHNFMLSGKMVNLGGGGFAFILLLPDSTSIFIINILEEFKQQGFSARMTHLNCEGVTIESLS